MASFKNTVFSLAPGRAVINMSGARDMNIGPPPQYGGSDETLNPEEMFVASINSCLMLVFYHFADKNGVTIESYEASAEGIVAKTRNGLRFTTVDVKAKVKAQQPASKLSELGELAERFCLVSNSVSCPVNYKVSTT